MTQKIKLLFLLAMVLMSAQSMAQVTVFPECNFLGEAEVLPVGNYSRADLIRRGVGDNAISSIIVSEGFEALIYEKDRFRGRFGTVTSFSQCLDTDKFDNNISSVKVVAIGDDTSSTPAANNNLQEEDTVQVFADCYYRGRSASLKAGEYSAEHLRQLGIPDNSISSVRVPKGMEISMYHNDFYRGQSGKLGADSECLVKRFNDVVSSLVVAGEAEEEGIDFTNTAGTPVTVYTECDYRGQSAQLQPGEYNVANLKTLGIADNAISSFRVPEGIEFSVFFNDFQRGVSTSVNQSARCLQGSRFDAQISSVSVKESAFGGQASTTESSQNQLGSTVTLYGDCKYRGTTAVLAAGEYRRSDLTKLGIADNSLSAIRIPDGYRVQVYENDFFRGGTLTLTASESCLANKRADNAISSLIVEEIVPEAPEAPVMSALDKQQLKDGLVCVETYVKKDLCTPDAWNVMSNFCQLEKVEFMSDGYLEGHVNKGNCTSKNWKELVRRISNPEFR